MVSLERSSHDQRENAKGHQCRLKAPMNGHSLRTIDRSGDYTEDNWTIEVEFFRNRIYYRLIMKQFVLIGLL